MNTRLLICIPYRNRAPIVERCVPTIYNFAREGDRVLLCDDGSTDRPSPIIFKKRFGVECHLMMNSEPAGVEDWRRNNLRLFWHAKEFTHLYLTDSDAPHDPDGRSELLRLQALHGGAPICGYNTRAHSEMIGNTIEDSPASEVIWRHYAPGVSYLLTRAHIEVIGLERINSMSNFDWQIPDWLGNRFAVTRTSYVSHIGYGGLHHGDADVSGGDVPLNPTPWLVAKRAEIVRELQTP